MLHEDNEFFKEKHNIIYFILWTDFKQKKNYNSSGEKKTGTGEDRKRIVLMKNKEIHLP